MDFTLTEAQRELAALTRKILDSSDAPWADLVKAGVVPEHPDEFGVLEQCAVLVELGRAVSPVPYLPTMVASSALAGFGTPEQRERWLTPGTVLSVALADDVDGAKTTVPFASTAAFAASMSVTPNTGSHIEPGPWIGLIAPIAAPSISMN